MTDSDTTIENLVPMIRDILDGKDLCTMTLKIVRETILGKLDTPPVDLSKFKSNVKTALTTVLAECDADTSNPADKPDPKVKDEPKHSTADIQPSENIDAPAAKATAETVPAKAAETEKEGKSIKARNGGDSPKELSGKESSSVQQKKRKSTGEDDSEQVKRARIEKADKTGKDSSKTAKKKNNLKDEDDDEGDDDNDDNDDNDDTFKYDEELISGDDEGRKSNNKEKKVKRQGSKGKRERVSTSSTGKNKQYEKLNGVIRALGLRMPVSRLKGKSPDERCEAVRVFLKSKGVDDPVPTALTRKELQVHKRRLEREKDMIDIDVRYVLALDIDGHLSMDCASYLYANNVSLTFTDFSMLYLATLSKKTMEDVGRAAKRHQLPYRWNRKMIFLRT